MLQQLLAGGHTSESVLAADSDLDGAREWLAWLLAGSPGGRARGQRAARLPDRQPAGARRRGRSGCLAVGAVNGEEWLRSARALSAHPGVLNFANFWKRLQAIRITYLQGVIGKGKGFECLALEEAQGQFHARRPQNKLCFGQGGQRAGLNPPRVRQGRRSMQHAAMRARPHLVAVI